MAYIISFIFGYLFGSIPFGLVIVYMAGLGDIRKIGSGNIGATNVLRTGRKDLTLLTLIFDIGKAGFASMIMTFIFANPYAGLVAGTAGVLGHNFPVWLKFKGGKGVASTIGMMLATSPMVGVMVIATWLGMAFTFKYSSLSALTAMAMAPIYALIWSPNWNYAGFYLLLSVLSFYRHRENIKRLLNHTETKIKLKK